MRNIADYIFGDRWWHDVYGIAPGRTYAVSANVGELEKGSLVEFIGFADADNHFGIFVFTDAKGEVLEVRGDFSAPDGTAVKDLQTALSKTGQGS